MTARTYRDRLGRIITDPASIEHRRILQQLRRLMTLAAKAGLDTFAAVTVGDLARAAKKTPDEIVAFARDGWLTEVCETDGPMESWVVFEDGE